jgi:hypothetical protein
VPPHKKTGKRVFVNRFLCSTKTRLQGKDKRLKKISTPRYASGSIFLAVLASAAATLHFYKGLTAAYRCARLRVARANRAVTIFACYIA